ncbi:MAG: zf-HC2 domain-containing protein [Candidatus Hydrogenedentes bacterium]|nr:zf-HC2 domain-containing protein [Candidatus Hydrogenedentota bacterium]
MKAYSNCEDVREDFSALLDGELSPQEQEAVESHLADCSQCLRELDGLKRIDTLYGELPHVDAPQGFEGNVQELLNPKRVVPWPKRARDWRIMGTVLAMAAGLVVVIALMEPDGNLADPFYTAKMTESDSTLASAPATAEVVGGRVASKREMADEEALGALGYSDADDAPSRQLASLSDRPPGAAFPRENAVDALSVEGKTKNILLESNFDSLESPPSVVARSPVLLEQEVLKKELQELTGDKALAEPVLAGVLADGEAEKLSMAARSESSLDFAASQEELRRDVRMRAAIPADLSDAFSEKDDLSALVRHFDVREGVWYERGYAGEPTIALERDSDRWRGILEQSPDLRPLVDVREQVVFRFNEIWYALKRVPEFVSEQVLADE